jgi:phosphate transport system substrate-binding protein
MKKFNSVLSVLALLCTLTACKQKPKPVAANDHWQSGTAKFAADESFRPVIEQEDYIFTSLHASAKPVISYKNEDDAVRLLLADSVRMVMLSRELDSAEVGELKTRQLIPYTFRFAVDAATVIVNQVSNDTLLTVGEIKKMLTGDAKTAKNIVFDSPGSSLLRYFQQLAGVTQFKPKNIFALKNNKEVIRYVSTHPDAIGITSLSWLEDPDADYADAVKNVKIVAVGDESSKKYAGQYFKPSQSTLYLKQYPLSRDLFIINCTGKMGLGTGFSTFITGDKGQRIVQQSGILPNTMPEREINIKRSFN